MVFRELGKFGHFFGNFWKISRNLLENFRKSKIVVNFLKMFCIFWNSLAFFSLVLGWFDDEMSFADQLVQPNANFMQMHHQHPTSRFSQCQIHQSRSFKCYLQLKSLAFLPTFLSELFMRTYHSFTPNQSCSKCHSPWLSSHKIALCYDNPYLTRTVHNKY